MGYPNKKKPSDGTKDGLCGLALRTSRRDTGTRNQVIAEFTVEIRRRADIKDIDNMIAEYISEWTNGAMDGILRYTPLAEAISKHFTEGLEARNEG